MPSDIIIPALTAGWANLNSAVLTTPTIDGELSSSTKQQALSALALVQEDSVSGTFGSNKTTFDLPVSIAGDTKGGFKAIVRGSSVGAEAGEYISVRVNGTTVGLAKAITFPTDGTLGTSPGTISAGSVGTDSVIVVQNGEGAVAGAKWEIIISCQDPNSACLVQHLEFIAYSLYNPTASRYLVYTGIIDRYTGDEITSIGVASNKTSNMAATSQWIFQRI